MRRVRHNSGDTRLQPSLLRFLPSLLCLTLAVSVAHASAGPTDPKAQNTYAEAEEKLKQHHRQDALDLFKKADKQDGHHCADCLRQAYSLHVETGDYKHAAEDATELLGIVTAPVETATAHADRGFAELRHGQQEHKQDLFAAAHGDFAAALSFAPNDPGALYGDGMSLANLSQDDAAKQRFATFVKVKSADSVEGRRAIRYVNAPQLARERMAPPFNVTTLDGKNLSLDDLQGKVVLIDFWATWCGPCREALPHVQHIAQKFAGEPLVVLSVSLDTDDEKWKSFVAQHNMTWPQTRDGGFEGSLSREFQVTAIPHTFTIDADGVLQDEHVGDAAIEGKLKKLIAQARQLQRPASPSATEVAKTPQE